MILLISFLMACAVLIYPVFADVKRHGKDNILVRSASDLARYPPIAAVSAFIAAAFKIAIAVVGLYILVPIIIAIISFLWWLISRILK
jgi:hypothetical protein